MDKQTLDTIDALQSLLTELSRRISMIEDSLDSLRGEVAGIEETLRQHGMQEAADKT